jgi:hypothetical protein
MNSGRLAHPERSAVWSPCISDIRSVVFRRADRVATTEFIQGAEAQVKALGTDPALVFIPHPV